MSANAEIIAELRRVLNERDEARTACPDCAMWAERSARWHDDMQRAERERDEAIACFGNVEAKLNAVRVALDRACGESREAQWDRVTALAKERDEARADAERYLADLRRCASEPYEHAKERAEAYRRGAEAMREACARWIAHKGGDERIAWQVGRLPIPEKP